LVFAAIGLSAYFLHIPGCSLTKKDPKPVQVDELPDTTDEAKKVGEIGNNVGEVGGRIGARADSIEANTNDTRTILDNQHPGSRDSVEPQLDAIDNEAKGLRDDSAELKVAQERLTDIEGQLLVEQERVESLTGDFANANSKIQSLEEENRELKDKANRLFKEKMAWIGVISVFGIGISVMLIFFTRSSAATMVALGFAATLGISIAVSLYMQYIAWVTIAVVAITAIGVIGYLVYMRITDNKTVDELVRTGEVTKDYLTQEARDHIFGRGAEPGVADSIQSKGTKRQVQEIRHYNTTPKRGFQLASSTGSGARVARQPIDGQPFMVVEDERNLAY
tara:strand:- start:86483 stop:87490 length:1008 start_codon:yes stop_codon:yes gene_type:complete